MLISITSANEAAPGDKIFNGADDDASGCVAVLELARTLAAGRRPRRTVYFVCFGSEERGGYGARYFVDHSPVPLDHIVADITFEMLEGQIQRFRQIRFGSLALNCSNLGSTLARLGALLVADPHPEENFFQRSDNYTLALRGVVAHTVSSFNLHSDYHRPSDELSKIDFPFMTRSIKSLIFPTMAGKLDVQTGVVARQSTNEKLTMEVKPKFFSGPVQFRGWLEKNHDKKSELLVGLHKKGAGKKTLTYAEALDEALCFGWIDGVRKNFDEISYTIPLILPGNPKASGAGSTSIMWNA